MLGFLGLGLDDWFRLRAQAGDARRRGIATPARNCILIWLAGGPSHLDTFDPKPDAPADVRGEFKPIATSVPGLQISEVFPKLAKMMDRVTLIRSMTSPEADHDRASHHLLTGYRPSPALDYPSYGSVVSKIRQTSSSMLPPYVAIPDGPAYSSSGYLTPAYDPFAVSGDPNQENFRVRNLTPPDQLTLERLLRRRAMVKSLDEFARDVPPTPLTTSRDQFADRAYSLMTSSATLAAFRLGDESPAVRDKYGRTTFGQSCLLARRLVEAGVSFVTLNDRGTGPLGWDTHAQNFPTIKNTLAPPLDQGPGCPARGPGRPQAAREHARGDDGRIRPNTEDQPERRPRPSWAGQQRAHGRRGDSRRTCPGQDRCSRRSADRTPGHAGRSRGRPLPQAGHRSRAQVRGPRWPADPPRR